MPLVDFVTLSLNVTVPLVIMAVIVIRHRKIKKFIGFTMFPAMICIVAFYGLYLYVLHFGNLDPSLFQLGFRLVFNLNLLSLLIYFIADYRVTRKKYQRENGDE